MINKAKKIIGSVWVGKTIRANQKSNLSHPSLRGKVIDETKNLFILKTLKGIKKAIKKDMNFEADYQNKTIKVDGKILHGNTEERMKKKVNK